jgi:large conductance mechanosensitive channel
MTGFKAFILRGNLVEIAVGLIMALAFAAVVTAFTDMLMSFIGKIGGQPDFSSAEIAGVNVGQFINAVIAFLIMAAVVYFFVVVPYTKAKEKFFPTKEEDGTPEDVALLTEIRDLLATRNLS